MYRDIDIDTSPRTNHQSHHFYRSPAGSSPPCSRSTPESSAKDSAGGSRCRFTMVVGDDSDCTTLFNTM